MIPPSLHRASTVPATSSVWRSIGPTQISPFAEFERAMLRERTKIGLETARGEGRVGGRRPKLTSQQQAEIVRMISRGRKTADAARLFGVHPATLSRLLARARVSSDLSRSLAR
jgi:DNA invertase Pin-like site-specific DNA recombinase